MGFNPLEEEIWTHTHTQERSCEDTERSERERRGTDPPLMPLDPEDTLVLDIWPPEL